jgi:peptide/nickel transport system substrate-binding protein
MGHNDTKSESVSFLLFNRLFKLNTDFEVVPDLAESWEQPSDTEWVIKIKEGVMFHDGTEMTSEDVVYSLLRSKEMPKVQQVLSEVNTIEVVDTYTVKFVTESAFAPFLYTLVHAGTSIVPKGYVESGDDFVNPVGSGPYTFVEWVSGDKVVLVKNADYFDADNMGQSETITFRVIPEGTSRTIALETGEVDVVMELQSMDASKVTDNADLELFTKPSTSIAWYGMNTEKPPFDNKLVRQAFQYAIDKEAVLIVAIDGAGIVANSVMAPSFLGYKDGPYTYDPEKAKALLTEAGYPDGFEMSIWASGDERKRIAEVVQANLMDIGVTASIEMLEWGTYIDRLLNGEEETYVLSWTSNPDPDATLTPHYFSGNVGGMNFARIVDPKIDEMLKNAREELDLGERELLYNDFHDYINDQAPNIPLFVKNVVVGANKDLQNVELSPQGLWNLQKLHY